MSFACLSRAVFVGGEDLLVRTNLRIWDDLCIWDVLGILDEVAWDFGKVRKSERTKVSIKFLVMSFKQDDVI